MNDTPIYLLDTSALVKRYHLEPGRSQIDALFALSEKIILISDLTVVEMHSFAGKKVRAKTLSWADFRSLLEQFSNDIRSGVLNVICLRSAHKRLAVELLDAHSPKRALRTLDALQLAMATDLCRRGRLTCFVTADESLERIAELEGINVLNPEKEMVDGKNGPKTTV